MKNKDNTGLLPFRLEKQYKDYVWGGSRLRPGHVPTAEAWTVYETNAVLDGPFSGQTLADLTGKYGKDLLGTDVISRSGSHFPILVKILDCNEWLSLQVHPNDSQAEELEGPGEIGKTEAWYFLDAGEKAEILCGIKPAVTRDEVAESVRNGTILDKTNRLAVAKGDNVLIPAGMIHALGPGMLVYEVQQSSNITYRVFDWNRPASDGRALHIDKSIRVIDPALKVALKPSAANSGVERMLSSEYFTLEKVVPANAPIEVKLDGTTFHALTVVKGSTSIHGKGWQISVEEFESLLIPASTPGYTIDRKSNCEILRVTA